MITAWVDCNAAWAESASAWGDTFLAVAVPADAVLAVLAAWPATSGAATSAPLGLASLAVAVQPATTAAWAEVAVAGVCLAPAAQPATAKANATTTVTDPAVFWTTRSASPTTETAAQVGTPSAASAVLQAAIDGTWGSAGPALAAWSGRPIGNIGPLLAPVVTAVSAWMTDPATGRPGVFVATAKTALGLAPFPAALRTGAIATVDAPVLSWCCWPMTAGTGIREVWRFVSPCTTRFALSSPHVARMLLTAPFTTSFRFVASVETQQP